MEVKKQTSYQEIDQTKEASAFSWTSFGKFFIPSFIGILLFLVPIPFQGKVTIGVGILAESVQSYFADQIPLFMTILVSISALGALAVKMAQPAWLDKRLLLKNLFDVSIFWTGVRIIGAVFAVMTMMQVGPEFIWSDITGGTVLYSLVPVLTTWFLFAALLMPFLMSFGLMDFIGTLLRKVMQPVFKLPGRSAIDATASWMGAGPVGVLITTQQFEQGYYTKREASVIATNFSIASIAFSLVVITFIGLEQYFVPFYLVVTLAVFAAAVIVPRIPPLSRKKDEYDEVAGKQIEEYVPTGKSSFQSGLDKAMEQAEKVPSYKNVIYRGFANVLDIWLGLIPVVMGLGTLALVLAEFTPVFVWLSYPLVPVLEWMQIPEANEAAPALIVGFADMFLPAVIGSGIESELTRFVIAGISITQLIYMSEIGVLILKSKIPLSIGEMFMIFLQRTVVTLPIIVIFAHFIF
ncbi:nucleoside recognition GATE domain-containing membrane protein YjiH [Thalassobacillus cyri]|uniref:Nucleoside recognition GATE domain-containing membrane protein YjiH n=1 Tax=Thalassobacillus cyri TaxID=571932 RepID=A0A1H4FPM7_9BACI|nr:YjiH family protein [Thalassobacillus cyri]SEA99319.1 nucleoside recognition GATE domain-containing membrane protein YjiH [Thalassobacillus cyri]